MFFPLASRTASLIEERRDATVALPESGGHPVLFPKAVSSGDHMDRLRICLLRAWEGSGSFIEQSPSARWTPGRSSLRARLQEVVGAAADRLLPAGFEPALEGFLDVARDVSKALYP